MQLFSQPTIALPPTLSNRLDALPSRSCCKVFEGKIALIPRQRFALPERTDRAQVGDAASPLLRPEPRHRIRFDLPQADNPEGFWEHFGLLALSDELLNALGGAWDLPPKASENFKYSRLDHRWRAPVAVPG